MDWIPAPNVYHNFTLTFRSSGLFTFKITDGDTPTSVWTGYFSKPGYFSKNLVARSPYTGMPLVLGQETSHLQGTERGDHHIKLLSQGCQEPAFPTFRLKNQDAQGKG